MNPIYYLYLINKITLLIIYFLDLKFLFIVIHVKDKSVVIFHTTKEYIIFTVFDVNFPRKFLLCPFSYMSSCAIMTISHFIFHIPKKIGLLFKKLDVFS